MAIWQLLSVGYSHKYHVGAKVLVCGDVLDKDYWRGDMDIG